MLESFNRVVDAWFSWHAAMLWQVSLLIAMLWLIDRLIRRWAWPQLRYALWLLVLVKLVIPPTFSLPTSVRGLLPVVAHNQVNVSVDATVPPPVVEETAAPQESDKAETVNPALNISLEALAPPPPPEFPTEVTEPEPNAKWTWKGTLFVVWLTGVASLLIALIVRVRQVRIIYALSDPEEIPDWFHGLVARAAEELDLRATPRVVLTDKMGCPAVLGLWRPILLMPIHQVNTLQREDVHHMLLHELAHIKRADLWVHALATLLTILYWFNPLIWFIRRPMENLRELCCDATVASLLREQTAAYRETLLARAREMLAAPADPGLGLLGLMEDTNWLSTRLRSLDRPHWKHRLKRGFCTGVFLLVMCCCVLPMSPRTLAKEVSSVVLSDDAYRVTLSSGVTLEVVALRELHEDYVTWWLPDGTPLEEPLFDESFNFQNPWSAGDGRRIEIALRHSELQGDWRGHFRASCPSWLGKIPLKENNRRVRGSPVPFAGYTYSTLYPSSETETVDVTIKMSTGPWENWLSQSPSRFKRWYAGYTAYSYFTVPHEKDGTARFKVSHTLNAHDVDYRVTALDFNNVEHLAHSSHFTQFNGVNIGMPHFDLPLDDIATVWIQYRPYEIATLKNISIVPGRRPNERPYVTTSMGSRPRKWRDPETPSQRRYRWQAKLAELHSEVVGYLATHEGEHFPKLSDLGLQPQERTAPSRSFVADVAYFSGPAFNSLSAEMFRGDQAQVTPVAWVKPLLEYEELGGTHVLYGDGRIEWVTHYELENLKSQHLLR